MQTSDPQSTAGERLQWADGLGLIFRPDRPDELIAEIRVLADQMLHHPVTVTVASESPAADTVGQVLYHVEPLAKLPLPAAEASVACSSAVESRPPL